MGLSAGQVWEVRTTGSDSNSGAFKAGASGTDRSQADSAFVTFNGSTVTATTSGTSTTIAITGYTVIPGDVGNVVQIAGGTNFTTGFYEITAVDTTLNTWTLDRNCTAGAGAAMTGAMGGALATLGKLAAAMVASNKAFVKAGAGYTSTATITFAQTCTPGATVPHSRLVGYTTTRGDGGKATLTLATNTGISGLKFTGNGWYVENMAVDCANLGTSIGLDLSSCSFSDLRDCKVSRFTSIGIKVSGTTTSQVLRCEVTTGTSAASAAIDASVRIAYCYIHDNSCPGIISSGTIISNVIANNSGASSDGVLVGYGAIVLSNTIYKSGRDGISHTADSLAIIHFWQGNLLAENGRYGINGSSSAGGRAMPNIDGNAYYSNTSGTRNNMDDTATNPINGVVPYTNVFDVILTADPFMAKASNDFRLNNTAGGGAACRGHGVPQSWPGNSLTLAYPDMGAAQHQDAGGGAPMNYGILDGGGM